MTRSHPKTIDREPFRGIETAVVLGSGLLGVIDGFPIEATYPFDRVDGVGRPDVPGHAGEFRRCRVSDRACLFVCGRKHFYEGGADAIVSLLGFVRSAGVRRLLLTSAAGSLVKTIRPEELVLVDDVLDFQFRGPLSVVGGSNGAAAPVERPAGARSLDPGLLSGIAVSAAETGVRLERGAAVTCAGPMYESPAEIRALQQTGASLVTMSGAPEIALAGAMGIPTAMIGLVTNWASGITGDPLRHEDVLETAGTAVAKLRQLVEKFVQLGPDPGANSGCGLPGQRV